MELTIDKQKGLNAAISNKKSKYWGDLIMQDFYFNYYQELSSKELDKVFDKDIRMLSHTLSKLPNSEKKMFTQILARYIEFYLEKKIEKEIDSSLYEILNF